MSKNLILWRPSWIFGGHLELTIGVSIVQFVIKVPTLVQMIVTIIYRVPIVNPRWPPKIQDGRNEFLFVDISTSDRGDFPRIIKIALFVICTFLRDGVWGGRGEGLQSPKNPSSLLKPLPVSAVLLYFYVFKTKVFVLLYSNAYLSSYVWFENTTFLTINYLKEGLHTAMLGVWNLGTRMKLGVYF